MAPGDVVNTFLVCFDRPFFLAFFDFCQHNRAVAAAGEEPLMSQNKLSKQSRKLLVMPHLTIHVHELSYPVRMMLEFADSRCSGGLWHCCNYVVDAQLDKLIQVVHGHTPSVVANCHEFRALLVRETVAVAREWRRWVGVSAVDHFVKISHEI